MRGRSDTKPALDLPSHGEGTAIVVTRPGVFGALTQEQREQLMTLAREVSFATGERIFNEGGATDRLWIIHTGTVALDVHVPGRQAAASL
jgi:hypothetical protein